MCFLMLLGALILLLVTIFIKSALVVLPWTATATVVAGLAAFQLGIRVGRTPARRAAMGALGTLALAFAFGYLGYGVVPPSVPPPKKGFAELTELPEPTADDLRQMFPIHLAIWGGAAAMLVGRRCYQHGRGAVS